MERCYVCNSCGKCAESALAVTAAGPRCLDCGPAGQPAHNRNTCAPGRTTTLAVPAPGEKLTECAACGSRNIAFAGPGASGAPAR